MHKQLFSSGIFIAVLFVLTLQGVASHTLTVSEHHFPIPILSTVPMEMGDWKASGEESLEPDVTDYLKPDAYILRDYRDVSNTTSINFFVAYFKSLQNSYGPHSPRVCLPGSGWLIRSSKIESLSVPGRREPIPVNEYVLDKSGNQILVIYWYQNNRAVWAEEFNAKLRLLPDLLKYHRSDESLVRIVTPLRAASNGNELRSTMEFSKLVFPILAEHFASTN